MLLTGRNVDNNTARAHVDGVSQFAVGVVEVFFEMAAEADDGFGGMEVTLDGHDCPGFDGIQHSPRIVFR